MDDLIELIIESIKAPGKVVIDLEIFMPKNVPTYLISFIRQQIKNTFTDKLGKGFGMTHLPRNGRMVYEVTVINDICHKY